MQKTRSYFLQKRKPSFILKVLRARAGYFLALDQRSTRDEKSEPEAACRPNTAMAKKIGVKIWQKGWKKIIKKSHTIKNKERKRREGVKVTRLKFDHTDHTDLIMHIFWKGGK